MGLFDTLGGLLGTDKSGDAIKAQMEASQHAADVQKQMYDQSRADLAPYREAGATSLTGMQDKDFQRDFTLADFQKDPGYQFRMEEGQKALERSASARGGLMSGAALKGIAQYGQNFASNEYQNAYNRFNQDRNTRFGRLSDIAHMGQASASQTADNSMRYGQSMSDLYTGLGNAQASAYIGNANRNAQMFGDIIQGAAAIKASDYSLKKDIEPISKEELSEMKRELRAYRFKYKDEKHGKGEHIGVMAQDLEKSKLGRTLVITDSNGNKQVDLGKALMLVLATWAEA